MTYSETLADLFRRNRRGIKPGLDATLDLANLLKVDLDALPMVLVAGTNGKGSVSSLIAHLCTSAGLKTGHYSSPHLLRFSERMRIDGVEITPERVIELWEQIRKLEAQLEHPPSFFEICTVMAHQYFQEESCDVVVFEVGLGGRLDATNAATPALSVITNIGLDHQHILGDTLEAIASEKAGIARREVPCIIGPQRYPEALATLKAEAASQGAVVRAVQRPESTDEMPRFVKENIDTARLAYEALRVDTALPVALPAFAPSALLSWKWPGRFELIEEPGRPRVLVDGAHNQQALDALVDALNVSPATRGKVRHILYSCVDTRDPAELLESLKPLKASISLCPSSVDRSLTAKQLTEMIGGYRVFDSVQEGLERLSEDTETDDIIVVTGSLFAVADAKGYLQHLERDPPIMG